MQRRRCFYQETTWLRFQSPDEIGFPCGQTRSWSFESRLIIYRLVVFHSDAAATASRAPQCQAAELIDEAERSSLKDEKLSRGKHPPKAVAHVAEAARLLTFSRDV